MKRALGLMMAMSAMAAMGVDAPLTTTMRRAMQPRPRYQPTAEDMEALAKAEEKRRRKADRKQQLK
ncbi:hypothetical protein MUN82_08835 [Hymenobacter aerilatus]|uniref:Uncharacterized protein n=1 Tax=Hymenobacter aerilatus TaxID=2932251 RepID=A0A8T9SYN2_9BACT|nr:hypothetical protein [Hymenobacter aerilatus]UOR07188.1 hypothetical protein MUN82_08835 [Hymenobacter aerilatus]